MKKRKAIALDVRIVIDTGNLDDALGKLDEILDNAEDVVDWVYYDDGVEIVEYEPQDNGESGKCVDNLRERL